MFTSHNETKRKSAEIASYGSDQNDTVVDETLSLIWFNNGYSNDDNVIEARVQAPALYSRFPKVT